MSETARLNKTTERLLNSLMKEVKNFYSTLASDEYCDAQQLEAESLLSQTVISDHIVEGEYTDYRISNKSWIRVYKSNNLQPVLAFYYKDENDRVTYAWVRDADSPLLIKTIKNSLTSLNKECV